MSFVGAQPPLGTVAKDVAYSNLYGVRISGLSSVVDFANFKNLSTVSGDVKTVTAATVNGSSVNIALTNCNPNELLATDAQTKFVSIPYGTIAQANSVPKRSASEFTAFSQLILSDVSNQITGGISPNQVVVNAVTPAAPRIYSLQLESTGSGAELQTVTSSAASSTAFLDPTHTITQIGLKSESGGTAQLNVNSAVANNSYVRFFASTIPMWSIGNDNTDDHFTFFNDTNAIEYLKVDNLGTSGRFTVTGDVLPPSGTIMDLGSTAKRFNSIALQSAPGAITDAVAFTGTNILSGTTQTIVVVNANVTADSAMLCQVEDFNGVYFTNGCPYATITSLVNGSFNLNVTNIDAANTIGNTRTTTVRYWILP